MMDCKKNKNIAFSLIETIVVLVIASMVLLAVLGVYNRARASASVIMDQLKQNRLQNEILQKIAEDIDRMVAPGFDTIINFSNKLNSGYRSARLLLESGYYGDTNQKKIYERIIWQTNYDPSQGSLILYRMHEGLNVEDKVFEKNADVSPSAGLYIPVASGVTFFELKVQQGENVLGAWNAQELPKSVRVALSFEPLQELYDGTVGVPEESITVRTIAVERTRQIPFQFVKNEFEMPEEEDSIETDDPNDMEGMTDTLPNLDDLSDMNDEMENEE
jgi:type II secretory pathway pseudopilin PulG